MSDKQGVVPIHGKEYRTVALRVNLFRNDHPLEDRWFITSCIEQMTEKFVVCSATVGVYGTDNNPQVLARDTAREEFGSGRINKTSAVENCSTSAIGRALAAAGYGGEEYCSADELVNALKGQEEPIYGDAGPVDDLERLAEEGEVDESPPFEGDLNQAIQDNIEAGISLIGEDAYHKWHVRMLQNICGVDTLSAVDSDESLNRFYYYQLEKLKMEEKDGKS